MLVSSRVLNAESIQKKAVEVSGFISVAAN